MLSISTKTSIKALFVESSQGEIMAQPSDLQHPSFPALPLLPSENGALSLGVVPIRGQKPGTVVWIVGGGCVDPT
jgi:hypothetical protein